MTSGLVGVGEGVAVLEMGPDILWFDIGVPQHIGRFPPCIGVKVINYRVLQAMTEATFFTIGRSRTITT